MKKRKLLFPAIFIILFSTIVIGCSDENDVSNETKGQLSVKITDAPSDDANIQGTFVTVSDVKIDGQSVEGFTKQTIEISAYQQGNAKLLISDEVEAKSYNSISLVLDYESDESGNAPGCYVLTDDSKKHDLAAESQAQSEITFQKPFNVDANSQTSLVVDFDLRKAVTRNNESSSDSDYKFVTSTEITGAFRVVNEENSGEVHGKVNSSIATEGEQYVFIYKKGDFNASAETQGEGASNVLFANAVTSAKVESDGSYKLSFLEEGDYEVHLASYEKNEGKSNFKTLLEANSTISGLLLNDLSVSAESSVELNISILGFLN
ncbi:MAG: DUF4382 domain-containing protein [Bacteroidota bacterium]